ncbi:AAA family ATPase [Microlunatus flavus]|uniref:Predicted ATPase n=1 Tax=Microlunatus flavus TaxID=1036181 RepID=A0A1H9JZJ6_9ACTN|nr:AAA family ATPase [Microlunatus flavus]SEQ91955.1 Predicted ATPase [Microlunatus flavus]
MRLDRRPVRRVDGREDADVSWGRWPTTLPVVDQVLREGLVLDAGVTFVVGENGSGKSTLLEGIAGAYGLSLEGGTRNTVHETVRTESDLHDWLRLTRAAGASRWGYFLRAETMHGYLSYLDSGAGGPGDPKFHELSHGESILQMVRKYLGSPGFYCLDEPETALSFASTLALVAALHELATTEGAQVVCATHSPVLAALPGATILEVGDWGLRETSWDDLVLVANWRSYLTDPHRYLRHVIDD